MHPFGAGGSEVGGVWGEGWGCKSVIVRRAGESERQRVASFRIVDLKFLSTVLLNDLLLVLPVTAGDNRYASFLSTLFATASTIYIAKLIIGSATAC